MVIMNMKPKIPPIWMIILGILCLAYVLQPAEAAQYANLYVYVTDCATGGTLTGAFVSVNGEVYRSGYTGTAGAVYFPSLAIYPGGTEYYQVTTSMLGYTSKSAGTYVSCSQTHYFYMCLSRCITCGVDVQEVNARDSQISAIVKNTGNSYETITVNFYVDNQRVGSTSVYLNSGGSSTVQQYNSFSCGNHQVRVEAVANCGSRDDESTTYQKACNCPLSVTVLDQDRDYLDASVYVGGSYIGYSSHISTTVNTGTYKVDGSREGYESDSKTVTCNSNENLNVQLNLKKKMTCGVDVKSVYADKDSISANIANTGNSAQNILVNFYAGGRKIGTKNILVNSGSSASVSNTAQYDCSNNDIKVEAISDCGSRDEESTTFKQNCACKLNVNVYDSARKPVDASIYLDGSYVRYGSYHTTDISTGSHRVEARSGDYDSDYETVNCVSSETINVDLSLSNQECIIEAHVKDGEGKPVDKATVEFNGEKKLTPSDGVVVFGGLNPGSYSISATKEGYKSDYASFQCGAGERKVVDIFLKKTDGNLKVHVSDCSTRDALEGADVDVINGVNKKGVTNEYGYAYFSGLASGNYEVSAIKSGYKSNYKDYVRVSENDMTVVEICLEKEEGMPNEDECTLDINVENEDGDSTMANIYIDGKYYSYDDQLSADVDAGTHTVKATKSGYESDSETVTCNEGETESIILRIDGEDNGGDEKECTFNVRVRDEDDDALEANIYIDGRFYEYDDYATIDVEAGDHTIKVTRSSYDSEEEDVSCHDGETEDVYITLEEKNGDGGNEEDCDIRVYVRDQDNDRIEAEIYVDGDYEARDDYRTITVDEGRHTIRAQKSGYRSDSEAVYCENGDSETVDLEIEELNGEDTEPCDSGRVEVISITLNPEKAMPSEIIRGEISVKLNDLIDGYETVETTINVDGSLFKRISTKFDYEGEEKIVTFALEAGDYSIGSHTVEAVSRVDSATSKKTKTFYVQEAPQEPVSPYPNKHCLRINDITVSNGPVRIGDKTNIDVFVENCGEFSESSIALKLENSDVQFANNFTLAKGSEQKISFSYNVKRTEDLTFTVWNKYYTDSKTFQIKPESGYLAIYLEPSYTVYTLQDNQITFKVRNIGKVQDTFEISVSENIRPWAYGLQDKVTLAPNEEATLQMFVNPGSNKGKYDFGITGSTAVSQKTVASQISVVEPWRMPTGDFMAAIYGLGVWAPWLCWLLLIILLLLLLWWLWRKVKGDKKVEEAKREMKRKEGFWFIGRKQVQKDYGEELALMRKELEEASQKKKPKRFWWEKDCIEYDKELQ